MARPAGKSRAATKGLARKRETPRGTWIQTWKPVAVFVNCNLEAQRKGNESYCTMMLVKKPGVI